IDKYDVDHRVPPTGNLNTYSYNTTYLTGRMEKILELGEILNTNDYNNFDGYQNPFSGSKTIYSSWKAIPDYHNTSLYNPAICITPRNDYHYSDPNHIYPDYLKGTIIIFMQNTVKNVEVYYIDNKGKTSEKIVVSP
ncbi:MAG: hypothetical protein WCR27_08965, partial [Eubacteriales bacterium]